MTRHLAALALVPLVAGPAAANPCRACAQPVKKIFVDRVKVKKVFVDRPVLVPAYFATIAPQPAVTYNITTPPLPQTIISQTTATTVGVAQASGVAQAGYAAPQQQAAPFQQQAGPDALAQALNAINARLCQIEQRVGIGPQALAGPHPGAQVFAAKCLVCHSKAAAGALGKGHALEAPDPAAKLLMLRKARAGQMPPPGNDKGVPALTPQEVSDLERWLLQ